VTVTRFFQPHYCQIKLRFLQLELHFIFQPRLLFLIKARIIPTTPVVPIILPAIWAPRIAVIQPPTIVRIAITNAKICDLDIASIGRGSK
jgi:hypothetical protein